MFARSRRGRSQVSQKSKNLRAGLEGGGNLPALGCNIETMTHTRPTAYIDNFKVMMITIIVALPLLLRLRRTRSIPRAAAVAHD
jgi:hypothetical protein